MNADPLDAACLGIPTLMFFPEHGSAADAYAAIRICRRCPIVDACREHAIDNFELGVWGGTTERQREHIRSHRASGTVAVDTATRRRTVAARQQVAALIGHYTAGQIADRLGVNVRTIERHKAALRAAAQQEAA